MMKSTPFLSYGTILLTISLSLLTNKTEAQTTNLGDPLSWNSKIVSTTVPISKMLPFDMALQLYEDSISNSLKSGPWRFGFNHYVDLSLSNSGLWTTLPNGDRIWRIGLQSTNALTINLIFEEFDLPDGANVSLYDANHTNKVGAYTSRNNNPEQKLGTELVHGDFIFVEYFEPQAVQGQGVLKIGTVTHGYKELGNYANTLGKTLIKSLNSSGDCNIDVNCPLGTGWENQIRSVAMIVVGGNGICSGALINNESCDFTPYFLTANHCYSGSIATWSFRFNWESPPGTESCATTANSTNPGPPYDQSSNGGTVRANDSGSDFLLLEMNMSLAEAQSWNVFFAGWDNSETTPTQVTGVHHPSGDVKKICQDDGAVFDTWNFNGDPNTQVWRVNDWAQGVTEPGSSGSPLFDQAGRIIGDLSGGTAACSGTNDNGGYDGYGRFGISWNGGGTSSTRVRDWLDPSNTATTNNGCDPSVPALADDAGISSINNLGGTICGASFDPEVALTNYGTNTLTSVTITYNVDALAPLTFNWTGSLAVGNSVNIAFPTMTATNGAHTFNASTSLPNGNTDSNAGNDGNSNPFYTVIGGEMIDFTLDLDCWGNETSWEVQDAGTTLYSGGTYSDVLPGGITISETWCLALGCYDFIINDSFGDGMYGTQYGGGCTVNGSYSIDQGANQLATMMATNSDFGTQEINNFCVVGLVANNPDFSGTPATICPGASVAFTDLSTGATPTAWAWTFPGGTPPNSSLQNPTVVYNTVGVYDVTLVVTSTSNDTEIKTNYIIVEDIIAPAVTCPVNQTENPNASCQFTLPDYTGMATVSDNCNPSPTMTQSPTAGTVISGNTTITITADDGNGNTTPCTFDVILNDATNPTAVCQNINVYLDGTGSASILASDLDGGSTDNCSGLTMTASQTQFTCADSGLNNVTFTVTDGNTNSDNCVAVVTLIDTISPVPDLGTILDVSDECQVTTMTPPMATDNCGGGITGVPDVTLPITTQGLTTVTWTYDDGNGNTSTQTQNVVITDATAPVEDMATLTNIAECGSATPTAPTATDNCSGAITGTPDVSFPITTAGLTVVTWTYDDGNGNTSTQTQNVTINSVDTDVTQAGSTLTADFAGATYQWLDCDNNYAVISGETNQSYIPAFTGNYAVEVTMNGCTDTSACYVVDYSGINELSGIEILVYSNPTTGVFNIELNGLDGNDLELRIIDLRGRLILSEMLKGVTGNHIQSVDITKYNSGSYIIELVGDSGVILSKKIIKE